jgi:excisionase family DNA binding protein
MDTAADTLCYVASSSAQGALVTEPWVSVDDVAAHLGVAKDSVYRWIDSKHLPAHKIGKLWKFRLSEVDEWVRGGGANEQPASRLPVVRRRKLSRKR